jgi:hypothetical protein
VRPLKKEVRSPSESVNDLKMDVCSSMAEAEPIEAVSVTVRPLDRVPERLRESDRDLNQEM